MTPTELNAITKKLFQSYQNHSGMATPPLVYLTMLIMDHEGERSRNIAIALLPGLIVTLGLILPFVVIRTTLKKALTHNAEDAPGDRLTRILKVPRTIEMYLTTGTGIGVGLYVGLPALYYGTNLAVVPWATFVAMLISLLVWLQIRLALEKIMSPYAIEEFHKHPEAALRGGGLLWPRQRWYLPYAFGLFVANTLMFTATIVGKEALGAYEDMRTLVVSNPSLPFLDVLEQSIDKLKVSIGVPLTLLGIFLLVNAALSAWRIAQHQSEAARCVQEAMQALASGKPKLPDWISTDEVGDLSLATAQAFEQLRAFSLSLGESANNLRGSAEQLGLSTSKQTEVLTLQATALQETQVTTQEIKETSALAAQKAEDILHKTEKADEISRLGQSAIEHSLDSIQQIGDQVREMSRQIKALGDRARQIGHITTTVKDLADQSNMLALNAAIEAVRSGEHGRGFGVVAREIRSLADQSIKATTKVREILLDISSAIRTSVSMMEQGTVRVEASIVQVREFGTRIQELAGIVRDNASSVRQITAAVTQQNSGIVQIVQAVTQLSTMMDQTMEQLRASDEALTVVNGVAETVTQFVGNYGWQGDEKRGGRSDAQG
ncbi:hypothetical protein BO221_41910 [Archangium sp. Cb G35]|uniref:methyl-accepting chemotaxis protein n=1 Tax=Archangium sp. Cb G35 TaxID=1920190 RepID=UPI0009367FEF|nr:methyl-accepting chemotaxis protein [Archangium sp. Cb G35]OJT18052.1 hypothetical protein BO221_41910 [Archangium sp. Cb G35]